MNLTNVPKLLRSFLRRSIESWQQIQKNLGAIHVLILAWVFFALAMIATSWMREWSFPPRLDQVFTCIAIATLLAGFAALLLDLLNRMEKLGYFLLAASLSCLYWAEREREQYQVPSEISAFIKDQKIFPTSFLTNLWERLTSNIAAIREPAAAEARKLLSDPISSPHIAPLVADSLVVAAKNVTADRGTTDEVQKTTASLVAVKDQLSPATKKYVEEKIQQAEANATTSATAPLASPDGSTSQDSLRNDVVTKLSEDKDTEGKLKAAKTVAAITRGTVDAKFEPKLDTSASAANDSSPAPVNKSALSDSETVTMAAPLTEIVTTAGESAETSATSSKAATDATAVREEVIGGIVPKILSDLSDQEVSGELPTVTITQQQPPVPAPSVPPPDPNKSGPTKKPDPLDNRKSLRLEAELLLTIKLIGDMAKNSRDGEMPYAQLRELRLRLDSKKGGDLRNLAEPSKVRVLKKLDDLDRRLKSDGKAKAQTKKNYAEADLLRVGFLFPDEIQRLNVRLAQIHLNRNSRTSFYCPAIQNVGGKGRIPTVTEIRYFEYSIFGWLNPRDAESHAAQLATHLQRAIPGLGNVRTVFYKPERPDERSGNFEVWFSRNAFR